ncbi:carboxymuconolactone decarboxylase family protein [Sandaracinobacteroides sp. A072]|uniref:carboxymuconolactone decarboxylase family protein n=1 Tax=Sandaracinobacteroides sp. A072 TaxID=3461146 RepID=UPI0040435CBD
MTDKPEAAHGLPARAGKLVRDHPAIWEAYESLGEACAAAGPLDAATQRLVKLALAAAAGSEGAVHSHARRGLAEGLDPKALEQVALLAVPTLGFSAAMRALSWIEDVTGA